MWWCIAGKNYMWLMVKDYWMLKKKNCRHFGQHEWRTGTPGRTEGMNTDTLRRYVRRSLEGLRGDFWRVQWFKLGVDTGVQVLDAHLTLSFSKFTQQVPMPMWDQALWGSPCPAKPWDRFLQRVTLWMIPTPLKLFALNFCHGLPIS